MIKFKRIVAFLMCFVCALPLMNVTAYADEDYFSDEQKAYYKSLGLQGTTVNVYNWGEYISDGGEGSMDVVREFEKLTGAKVNYTNFESNENMYSKLSGGGVSYDVITPSDYMVERLIDEDMLLPLDYSNIPNMKYMREDCLNLPFDPEQKYSVCFNTGYTVLIYNKKLVKEKPDSWKVLWDEQYKGKVLMFNNSRDAFAIAQKLLGQSLNTQNEQDWVDAAKLLAEQKDKVNPVYVMDEVFNLMESGEYAFATYYVGDYVLMNENNPDLGYAYPKEGVNAFYDAFCIPKCTQNKKGAEAFINFMQEPEVALANEEYIFYASANKAVQENEECSLYGNKAVYPDPAPKSEVFKNLPQNILELENNLWSSVKSGNLSVNSKKTERKIYIESGVVAGVVVIAVATYFVRKRKKDKEQDLGDLYEQN
ncbi:ABC transporter substrate-binding protein [Eubacterium coprostanoligenes]|uniref:ABC transporter substrate-binding protein n=1 Tax=Eubacterium coprostanoligenes TaxID=290054 RepID=UPI00235784EA|nr:spermidine/putrescine ABC transporter substrate-binding protein [Eubacterium coprostanoligenes]MCI6354603.1 spermidine/putrescine ABC transporter substrate-binding protein [Eubacterium coprostanoligenes]